MQSQFLGNPLVQKYVAILGESLARISRIQLALVVVFYLSLGSVRAQLTPTEKLIQREVTLLGGQWEGSDSSELVSFDGKNFVNDHFEMLSHIRGIEWFHARGVNSSADSLRWLYSQDRLRKLDLFDCGELGNGIHFLKPSALKRIEQFRVSNIHLTDRSMETIASMPNLRVLSLEEVSLTPNAFSMLTRCKKLETLDAYLRSAIPSHAILKIQTELPKCMVTVTLVPGTENEVTESNAVPARKLTVIHTNLR